MQPQIQIQQREYVPIQDLELNEKQGVERQQLSQQQMLVVQTGTKSPTSNMQDSSHAFSPISRSNMFLTQR